MNNEPFYVGQPIVRVGPTNIFVTKGDKYTSGGCIQCSCGMWHTYIQELPVADNIPFTCNCGIRIACNAPYRAGNAKLFAPITEQYADITAEIAAGADRTDERPDVVKQPITIENDRL